MPDSLLLPEVFTITFEVPGAPKGKGRARAFRRGSFIGHYTPETTRTYEGLIRSAPIDAMKGRPPLDGPVAVQLTAIFDVPKSFSRAKRTAALANTLKPAKKPDLDNVWKAFADGMNGVVFKDDCQIVAGQYAKTYGAVPTVVVTVRPA